MTGPEGERLAVLESRTGELIVSVGEMRTDIRKLVTDLHESDVQRESRFLLRTEYQAHHDPLLHRLDLLESANLQRQTREEERAHASADRNDNQRRLVALAAVVITALNIAIAVALRFWV